MNTIPIVIASLLIVGFIVLYTILYSQMDKVRREASREFMTYEVACAGDYKDGVRAVEESVSRLDNRFLDHAGRPLNTEEYKQYVVSGNSMKLCGIHEGDILFVSRGFTPSQLDGALPEILVIKRRSAKEDEARFKVRHAWATCTMDEDFPALLKSFIENPSFGDLLSARECDGLDAMIDDFSKNRLSSYKKNYPDCLEDSSLYNRVVISTTLHTDSNQIRFSIHPEILVVGIVKYAFTVKA